MQNKFRFSCQSYNAASAQAWREQARAAEDLGYSAFHLADHYIGPGPALAATAHPVQDIAAVPAIAVAAEATRSIRVGCRVFCTGYRPAAVLVKEAMTLDFLSEGRLELGLGAGWLGKEYEAMGISFDSPSKRIQRLAETVRLAKAHMAGGQLAIDGEYVHAVGFEGVPRPVQQRVPIMIGGGSEKVLSLAAREADIVSLNFDNRSGVIGHDGVASSTADKTKVKIDWIREAAGDRFANLEIEIGAYFTVVTDQAAAVVSDLAGQLGLSTDEMGGHPHALIGSVDHICDELVRRREDYGISYVSVPQPVAQQFGPVVQRLTGT